MSVPRLYSEDEDAWNWWTNLPSPVKAAAVRRFRREQQSPLLKFRDSILPELHGQEGNGLEFDIALDFCHDQIWVKGYNQTTRRVEKFALTRAMVEDNVAADEFRQRMPALIAALRQQYSDARTA